MMGKDEAVQKLSKVARISEAYAEDLYDSFFEKPVVPQYVANWYEGNKEYLDYNIWEFIKHWDMQPEDEFKKWMLDDDKNPIITLVNMHRFGYEVEKEKRYRVVIKSALGQHLGRYYLNDEELTPQFSRAQFTGDGERPAFTRKELEDTGYGWVFDCEGIEIKEVE